MQNETLNFLGTHQEIGEQIGKQYQKWGKKRLYSPTLPNETYKKQLSLYEKYFPEQLLILEGIAKSTDYGFEKLLKNSITSFLQAPTKKATKPKNTCSVFGLKIAEGVHVGRNYDWLSAGEESTKKIKMNYTKAAYSYTAISDMCVWKNGAKAKEENYFIDMDDAWNEHGLFICLNGAPGSSKTTGLKCTHIIQTAIEKCKTTTEAAQLISEIPCNEAKIFTIIDKQGEMCVVEKPTHKKAKIRESKELIIATNHYQSKELITENLELFSTAPFHSTFGRQAYLETTLRAILKNCDVAANSDTISKNLADIMVKPPVMQNWRKVKDIECITIWTELLNLTAEEETISYAPKRPIKTI